MIIFRKQRKNRKWCSNVLFT